MKYSVPFCAAAALLLQVPLCALAQNAASATVPAQLSDLSATTPLTLESLRQARPLPPPDPAWLGKPDAQLAAQAEDLYQQTAALRAQADRDLERASDACWDRFFVSACVDDAKEIRRQQRARAATIEYQAKLIDRELRRRNVLAQQQARTDKEAERSTQGRAFAAKHADKRIVQPVPGQASEAQ